jgi:hypothetical protein
MKTAILFLNSAFYFPKRQIPQHLLSAQQLQPISPTKSAGPDEVCIGQGFP